MWKKPKRFFFLGGTFVILLELWKCRVASKNIPIHHLGIPLKRYLKFLTSHFLNWNLSFLSRQRFGLISMLKSMPKWHNKHHNTKEDGEHPHHLHCLFVAWKNYFIIIHTKLKHPWPNQDGPFKVFIKMFRFKTSSRLMSHCRMSLERPFETWARNYGKMWK
jgi:hypothetical protein